MSRTSNLLRICKYGQVHHVSSQLVFDQFINSLPINVGGFTRLQKEQDELQILLSSGICKTRFCNFLIDIKMVSILKLSIHSRWWSACNNFNPDLRLVRQMAT